MTPLTPLQANEMALLRILTNPDTDPKLLLAAVRLSQANESQKLAERRLTLEERKQTLAERKQTLAEQHLEWERQQGASAPSADTTSVSHPPAQISEETTGSLPSEDEPSFTTESSPVCLQNAISKNGNLGKRVSITYR